MAQRKLDAMKNKIRMTHEPTHVEIFLTKLAFTFFSKSVYKRYADSLPIKGDESVLDFGCGMGTVASYAANRLPRGHLTCLDLSARWLKACRKTLKKRPNVSCIKSENVIPALAKESYHLIYCHFVLHHMDDGDLDWVLSSLCGSLKPGGMLAFKEPLSESKKLAVIAENLILNSLSKKDSRVTDVPLMGTCLESIYTKLPSSAHAQNYTIQDTFTKRAEEDFQ